MEISGRVFCSLAIISNTILGIKFLRKDILDAVPLPASRFSLPASRFPLPASRFPLPASRFPLPASRFPLPASRFPFPASRFSLFTNLVLSRLSPGPTQGPTGGSSEITQTPFGRLFK